MYNLCHNNRTVIQLQPDPKSSIDRPSNTEADRVHLLLLSPSHFIRIEGTVNAKAPWPQQTFFNIFLTLFVN